MRMTFLHCYCFSPAGRRGTIALLMISCTNLAALIERLGSHLHQSAFRPRF
jgi:hypothetical protein